MSLFVWSPQYSIGSVEIDEQHQQLFRMADELHQAMTARRGKEVLAGLLKKLVGYTKYHFASEEKRMKESGYPGYPAHHLEHVKLTDRVMEYEKKVLSGETAISIEVMQFLSDWLKHHIQGSDQKVGAHLKKARQQALGTKLAHAFVPACRYSYRHLTPHCGQGTHSTENPAEFLPSGAGRQDIRNRTHYKHLSRKMLVVCELSG